VTVRGVAALVLACLAVAGCGAAGSGTIGGTARLWITRDRGATLMLDVTVPAGETVMTALRNHAKVDTRYGGRFVQAIDGVAGSLSSERDWFWFVNGLAGDTSAAEYRLQPGDIAWWDYRDWSHDPQLAVVAGAFPEPFLHGYAGKRRPTVVVYGRGLRRGAQAVARVLHTSSVLPAGSRVPADVDVFALEAGSTHFVAVQRTPGAGPTSPVQLTFAGDVERLLAGDFRRRFSVP
jgi:Domain of unknown function (DUF4430)